MKTTTIPHIETDYWVCGVCTTKITMYDLHGAPVEWKEKCPFCNREIQWERVVRKEQE